MAKVANVGEAMRKNAERVKRGGPTVLVRAVARGYYGYPLSDTKEPGVEFRMRVADLEPYKDKDAKTGKPPKNYMGQPVKFVTFEGTKYALPTWCEDASTPSSVPNEDVDEDEVRAGGDDVLG